MNLHELWFAQENEHIEQSSNPLELVFFFQMAKLTGTQVLQTYSSPKNEARKSDFPRCGSKMGPQQSYPHRGSQRATQNTCLALDNRLQRSYFRYNPYYIHSNIKTLLFSLKPSLSDLLPKLSLSGWITQFKFKD
jgi:hypothetical protein